MQILPKLQLNSVIFRLTLPYTDLSSSSGILHTSVDKKDCIFRSWRKTIHGADHTLLCPGHLVSSSSTTLVTVSISLSTYHS